jgi:hypothetical protein
MTLKHNFLKTLTILFTFLYCDIVLSDIKSTAQTTPPDKPVSLPLECRNIAGFNDQLCFIRTESIFGPYDDVVFYRINSTGQVIFLGSESNAVTTFGGLEFSEAGKYMWLSWAEEGHPHFEFYLTRDFLDNGTHARVLEVIGDYYFGQFVKFSDEGIVTYSLSDDFTECCAQTNNNLGFTNNASTNDKQYLKTINLDNK